MAAKPLSDEILRETVAAYRMHGQSRTQAAISLGLSRATFESRILNAKSRGLLPPPGSTTLYGPDQEIKLQWVRQPFEEKNREQWQESIKEVFGDLRAPKIREVKRQRSADLLAVYPIGDHHVGMYSWKDETGADYDIKIARQLLVSAATHLLNVTEDCETGLIVNVGDFFHVDNLKNETSRSHHTLDVDTRYRLMIDAGVDMLRTFIDMGLQKHRYLRVISTPGNHDDIGGQWLAMTLKLLYEKNPRVHIDDSPGKFHYYQFGKVMIGVTHGDTGKPEKLSSVMAADQPKMWGETEFRYWYTGHVHHRSALELPGVVWETFRTLAAKDAWATAAGHRSGRDMTSIVLHKEFGEMGRHRFDVQMLG